MGAELTEEDLEVTTPPGPAEETAGVAPNGVAVPPPNPPNVAPPPVMPADNQPPDEDEMSPTEIDAWYAGEWSTWGDIDKFYGYCHRSDWDEALEILERFLGSQAKGGGVGELGCAIVRQMHKYAQNERTHTTNLTHLDLGFLLQLCEQLTRPST